MLKPKKSNAGYADKAEALFAHYQSHSFEAVHAEVLDYIPSTPARILDIGCGSGRDAAYLARLGHEVTAVEPTAALLSQAISFHRGVAVEWLEDGLPTLASLNSSGRTFDLVILSGVWMHLNEAQRTEGMLNLAHLTHTNSKVIMSLRHGPVPPGRVMFEVGQQETTALAQANGFTTVFAKTSESIQEKNRKQGVWWTKLVFQKGSIEKGSIEKDNDKQE